MTDWGPGYFLGLHFDDVEAGATVKVGLVPSVSSGWVALDPDLLAVMKITSLDQTFGVETILGDESRVAYYDLHKLTLQPE